MPFINGRYYINPTLGAVMERVRAAEETKNQSAALADGATDHDADFWQDGHQPASGTGSGPIHQIHIETSEIVPSHSGRAARGFIAQIQRTAPATARFNSVPLRPETHVFTDHRDLLNFLLNQLSDDHSRP